MHEPLRPLWIDDPDGAVEVGRACRAAGRFALDSEADSLHSYFHKVCLLQVSATGSHYVLDPLTLTKDALVPLWRAVEDPELVVVMHGADYDLRMLDRDFQVRLRGLEDTQIMAQLLGEPRTGLAALLAKEFAIDLDKKYQRADWGRRPLSPEMLAYAATDTAHLLALADRLRRRLEDLGRWSWAEEEFRRLEEVRFEPPPPDPLAFDRIKGARQLGGSARDRLWELYEWREEEAKRRDLPPFKVLGNQALLALAAKPPRDVQGLVQVRGLGPRFARRWGKEVLRRLAEPRPAPPRASARPARVLDAAERARLRRLREVRDEIATALGLQPGLVASRSLLEGLVDAPARPDELARRGLVGWRHELLAEPFVAALAAS